MTAPKNVIEKYSAYSRQINSRDENALLQLPNILKLTIKLIKNQLQLIQQYHFQIIAFSN